MYRHIDCKYLFTGACELAFELELLVYLQNNFGLLFLYRQNEDGRFCFTGYLHLDLERGLPVRAFGLAFISRPLGVSLKRTGELEC